MSAPMRSGFDHEANVLEGRTIEQAREEAARLTAKANELTTYLARPRAGLTDIVRRNLEDERNRYEWEAAEWEARIAEHEGQVTRVREPATPLSIRAQRQRAAS